MLDAAEEIAREFHDETSRSSTSPRPPARRTFEGGRGAEEARRLGGLLLAALKEVRGSARVDDPNARRIPALKRYARDLNRSWPERGKLDPVIGRTTRSAA